MNYSADVRGVERVPTKKNGAGGEISEVIVMLYNPSQSNGQLHVEGYYAVASEAEGVGFYKIGMKEDCVHLHLSDNRTKLNSITREDSFYRGLEQVLKTQSLNPGPVSRLLVRIRDPGTGDILKNPKTGKELKDPETGEPLRDSKTEKIIVYDVVAGFSHYLKKVANARKKEVGDVEAEIGKTPPTDIPSIPPATPEMVRNLRRKTA